MTEWVVTHTFFVDAESESHAHEVARRQAVPNVMEAHPAEPNERKTAEDAAEQGIEAS